MKRLLTPDRLPILATVVVLTVLYIAAGLQFDGFFTARVALNLLNDGAFVGILAVGLTFVILTGGIDLSVGAMLSLSSILLATLTERSGIPFAAAAILVLGMGAAFGTLQGLLVSKFDLAPFLVTLGGLFFCSGTALMVSRSPIPLANEQFLAVADWSIRFGKLRLPLSAILFVLVLLIAVFVLRQTRFGRTVYAIGGKKESALLMGLNVGPTTVGVYALSGLCAALAGVCFCFYMASGNPKGGAGLELDAIAAVVIGGTLLSGGVGSAWGALLGVLTVGVIQTAITFQGTLSSWWTKIAIGTLLLAFMLMQRLISSRRQA